MSPKIKLPPANEIVWCVRKNGEVILARRDGKSLATSEIMSNECHWWDIDRHRNWQDGTVQNWYYISYPDNVSLEPANPLKEKP